MANTNQPNSRQISSSELDSLRKWASMGEKPKPKSRLAPGLTEGPAYPVTPPGEYRRLGCSSCRRIR